MHYNPAKEIHGIFYGEMGERSVAETIATLREYTQRQGEAKVEHVHIQFHSGGGKLNAGLILHDFLTAYPIPVTLYATVAYSAGALAFLGAKNRKAVPHGAFLLHGALTRVEGLADVEELDAFRKQSRLENERINAVLKPYLDKLGVKRGQWDSRNRAIQLGAARAHECGLLTAPPLQEPFRFPQGVPIVQFWCSVADDAKFL
jgi:ATP-dependent protease ClpP protease subunit